MKKNNMLSRAMWLCPVLKKGKGNIIGSSDKGRRS